MLLHRKRAAVVISEISALVIMIAGAFPGAGTKAGAQLVSATAPPHPIVPKGAVVAPRAPDIRFPGNASRLLASGRDSGAVVSRLRSTFGTTLVPTNAVVSQLMTYSEYIANAGTNRALRNDVASDRVIVTVEADVNRPLSMRGLNFKSGHQLVLFDAETSGVLVKRMTAPPSSQVP